MVVNRSDTNYVIFCNACKIFYFFMVVLIPTGIITVGSVVVMAAESRHPRTDVLG